MYEQKTEDVVLDVNGNVDVDDNEIPENGDTSTMKEFRKRMN